MGHRTRIWHRDTPNTRWPYMARCDCGWESGWLPSEESAKQVAEEHISARAGAA